MEKGRDKNEPSGNKTVPDWMRIKVNPTDLRIAPLKKSNQIAPNQSESNQIAGNQSKEVSLLRLCGQCDQAANQLAAAPTSSPFHPIRPGYGASIPASDLRPSPSSTTSIVPNRAQSWRGATTRFSLDVGCSPSAFSVRRSMFDVRCSPKRLLCSPL